MNLVELSNIKKTYGTIEALKGINLTIRKGTIHGLLGPNGAGKTTTINIISGLTKPNNGNLVVNIDGNRKELIGVIPQEISIYDELTVIDNLRFFAGIYKNIDVQERIDHVVKLTNIGEKLPGKVSGLSGGLKRRLNLAIGLINDPELVLMDEPTVGIDTQSRNFIYENIHKLKAEGKTIIYTTHYMEEAEKLCDYVSIIDEGRIIKEGTLDELLKFDTEIEFELIPQKEGTQILNNNGLSTSAKNGFCTIKTSNTADTLFKLAGICNRNNLQIGTIKTRRPTLEELYLQLTGKKLRE